MFTGDWFKSYVVQILPLIAFVIYMWGFAYYVAFYYEFLYDRAVASSPVSGSSVPQVKAMQLTDA